MGYKPTLTKELFQDPKVKKQSVHISSLSLKGGNIFDFRLCAFDFFIHDTSIFDDSTRVGYRKIITIENGRVSEQANELSEWILAALPQEFLEPN